MQNSRDVLNGSAVENVAIFRKRDEHEIPGADGNTSQNLKRCMKNRKNCAERISPELRYLSKTKFEYAER